MASVRKVAVTACQGIGCQDSFFSFRMAAVRMVPVRTMLVRIVACRMVAVRVIDRIVRVRRPPSGRACNIGGLRSVSAWYEVCCSDG